MNSYERVMLALERREPDRVPIVEFVISPGIIRALYPEASDQADFEELAGLDSSSCGPQFRKSPLDASGGYTDEWGVFYRPTSEVLDHPIRGPVESWEDLKRYTPPDPHAPHRLDRLREIVARFKHSKGIFFHQRAAFMWSAYVNGLDNLLMNFLADPEFAHCLLDKVLDANIQLARNALRAGAEVIVLGDDYAGNQGPMFSPKVYREFLAPRLKRMVDAVHEEGGLVIKHSDGNLWPLLDQIVDTGIDAINPIEPVAGMDIGKVKKKYGERVAVVGNIDCSHVLSEDSEEEVEAAVIECIRKASPGGGHILSSSNSIHSAVKPQNYAAMIAAAKKYGAYPIRLPAPLTDRLLSESRH
ncbi:MAG: uroporphyrinogen decarboxylase family protein [Bryobacteraceae bacterium]